MTEKLDDIVDFIFRHCEQYPRRGEESDEMFRLVPRDEEKLLPGSRAHFEKRVAQWKNLVKEKFGDD